MMRNALVGLMISHGTPQILGGDEWIRTQYGNTNAYSQQSDNDANWFRWGEWTSDTALHRHRMHDFTRKLIALRARYADALAPSTYDDVAVDWRSPSSGGTPNSADWGTRSVTVLYEPTNGGARVCALINMEDFDQDHELPSGTWVRALDTQLWYDTPGTPDESGGWFEDNPDADPYISRNIDPDLDSEVSGSSYNVKSRSIVVLVEHQEG
jgi:glycogen operon protein